MRRALGFGVLFALVPCVSQVPTSHRQLNLVLPNGPGRIIVPAPGDFKWKSLVLYDGGTRPVFFMTNDETHLAVSYVLFPNTTHTASPKICRDDVLDAAIRGASGVPGMADVKQVKKEDRAPVNGNAFATGSFLVASFGDLKVMQQNLFGVFASPTACAEVHISKTPYSQEDQAAMTAQLQSFQFDPNYVPVAADYFSVGSILFNVTKSYDSAAYYYRRALDTLPADATTTFKRVIVDQLAMSYGISGQLKKSRAVNEEAIKSDPDYPLYYYNLACADAEQGKAADAKVHLQLAFDRRANVLEGEKLPDPTKDDSIMKLKKNKGFWAFVEAPPKN